VAQVKTDPEILVVVDGREIPNERLLSWELLDDEKSMSTITVELSNEDLAMSGVGRIGGEIATRFGAGRPTERVRMSIAKTENAYPVKGRWSRLIQGKDDMQKLAGGKSAGAFGKNKTPRQCLQDLCKAHGLNLGGKGDGPAMSRPAQYNETDMQRARSLLKQVPSKGGGGKAPSPPFGKDKSGKVGSQERDQGNRISSATRIPEKGKNRDKNRVANQANQAGGEPVTGELALKWFPQLKAKRCIAITGAAPDDCGTWYVRTVTHSWRPGSGFLTRAKLIRGGTGKGSAAGSAPNVMYAEIYSPGTIYCGPRKIDGKPETVFNVKEDRNLILFKSVVNPQPQRHAGEPGKGKAAGIDPWNKNKPYDEAAAKKKAEAGPADMGVDAE
jgi:phage protein D